VKIAMARWLNVPRYVRGFPEADFTNKEMFMYLVILMQVRHEAFKYSVLCTFFNNAVSAADFM
jgi:hypothetical protein